MSCDPWDNYREQHLAPHYFWLVYGRNGLQWACRARSTIEAMAIAEQDGTRWQFTGGGVERIPFGSYYARCLG